MHFDRPFRGSLALDSGLLSRGRLRGPDFRRLFEDVYVAADVPVDLALRSRAAYLLVAGRGVLSGYSAAEILGASCGPADAPAEVTLPGGCLLRQPGLQVHRGVLEPDEVTTVGGIGVTTAFRAAYDLSRSAPSLVEAVVAVDALAAAGKFAPAEVLRLRSRHLGARDSRRLPEVIALADPLAESPMETRTRLALVLHGLPPPVSQFEVRGAGHCHYLDLTYLGTGSVSSTTAESTSSRSGPGATWNDSTSSRNSTGRSSDLARAPCSTGLAWSRSMCTANWSGPQRVSGSR
jgi:hypothetical protein